MQRIFALLDSRFLTRVGNLRTLGSVAVLGVGIVIGAVLAVLSVGPWWPVVGATAMWLTAMLVVSVTWRRHRVLRPDALPDETSSTLDRRALTAALDLAKRELERMLAQRFADAPNKPPGSGKRNYFGPTSYESTIGLYRTDHEATFADLFSQAHHLGYLPNGWGELVSEVSTVDQLWRLRYRAATLVARLRTKQKPPDTRSARVADLIKVGNEIHAELRSASVTSFERRQGTTPFQAFDAWLHDVEWLLRYEAPNVWHRFGDKPVPGRRSRPDELASFIDTALTELASIECSPRRR